MTQKQRSTPESHHALHNTQWRHPAQVLSFWETAGQIEPALMQSRVRGDWWEVLARKRITVLVTREYEHLVLALRADSKGQHVSFMRLPHPSGMAVDLKRKTVHIACTRNPNQIYDLSPTSGVLERLDSPGGKIEKSNDVLLPSLVRFFPGSLYLHDLAMIGGQLHGNAVGHNAIVRLTPDGGYRRVWWPKVVERNGRPDFGRNYLQLNSIAAGRTLAESYFSASCEEIARRRPGHRNFSVDCRGVIFSGKTRQPIARGLTRPHSARLHDSRVWVDNSGYGELGYIEDEGFISVVRLPGWTRGLCFHNGIAIVGTSRVLPRFAHYAPGLDVAASICGLHAVELKSGKVLGSLIWPGGNQIFAIEIVPSSFAKGFAFARNSTHPTAKQKQLFYAFLMERP